MPRQKQNNKRVIIGLTGSFGSGKTTVAGIFKSFGAKIIDADSIAHRVIRPSTSTYKKIIHAFGKGILNRNNAIDRNKLGKIVFNNRSSLKELNNIIHPEVIKVIKQQIKKIKSGVILLDAPLLIEAGLVKMVDKLLVVKINRKEQIKRIQSNSFLSKEDILKRIKAQLPLRIKARLADFVIDNSKTLRETRKQAKQIRRILWRN
jgi:dephospho-CoA kinase